ncbi:MAG: hypothetical protein ACD_78C00297G0002 [uncultured bacterium (gcode 4)]|uniref:Thioredoxin-like fold domain-containing protein n=1 Tax=uncultured bacterium (gcode 4) TaxID=1234023 RepID=K1XXS0_9BACT|nr:MAG: hypothetical protein ACD_78C00297G0002 [uncultured bacterium (gcode 4)]
MHIKIIGTDPERWELFALTSKVLATLGLDAVIKIEQTDDEAYKMELGITENPAFCIEETGIDFKDVIFQGIIPTEQEISSLLVSIVGGDEEDACGSGGCGSCGWGCH